MKARKLVGGYCSNPGEKQLWLEPDGSGEKWLDLELMWDEPSNRLLGKQIKM